MVDQADEGGFDVDEVADEAIDVPDFTEPALTLPDIDAALQREEFLPPGAERTPLDPGSCKLRLPGSDAWVRVTIRAEVFDDHSESYEFLSPGAFFETLAPPASEGASASVASAGHCWLVESAGES